MMNALSLMIIISSIQLVLCSEPNYKAKYIKAHSHQRKLLTYAQKNPGEYDLVKRTIPYQHNSKFQTDTDFKGPFDPWAGRKRAALLKSTHKTNKLLNLNKNFNANHEKHTSGHHDREQGSSYSKPQKRKILSLDAPEDSEDQTSQELSYDTENSDCYAGNGGFMSCYVERAGVKPSSDEMFIPWSSESLNSVPEQLGMLDTNGDKIETKRNYSPWGGKRSKVVPFSYSNSRGVSNYKQEGKITSEFNNRIRNFIFLVGGKSYQGIDANELNDLNEYIINNYLKYSQKLKSNNRIKRDLSNGKRNLSVLNDDNSYYAEEGKSYIRQNKALNSFENNKFGSVIYTPNTKINFDQDNNLGQLEGEEIRESQNENIKNLGEQKIVRNYSSWEEKKIDEFSRDARGLNEWEIDKEGNQSKNYIQSSPYRNLRNFEPWAGKRNFNFDAWGGKRNYNAWGGKRSYNPWGGKRNYNAWGGKRNYSPWGGKRNYNAWGGKRKNKDDKKSYNPWGGKRSSNPWGGKRSYNAWGGKRAYKYEKSEGNSAYKGGIKSEEADDSSKSSPNSIKNKDKEITVKKRFFENPESKLIFVKGDINTWINKTRKFNSWRGKRTLLF